MRKTEKFGRCKICNEERKLSFEHIPPKAAFNDKAIFSQGYEHLYNENSYVYGKKMSNKKGFGKYSLCESCNKLTGDWYARDFAQFCSQGMAQLTYERKPYSNVTFNFSIKPLNILKQITVMLMANEGTNCFQQNQQLKDFVLNKESKILPENFDVYLYCSLSNKKKILGYSMGGNKSGLIMIGAEINFHPFGYLLIIKSSATKIEIPCINSFLDYDYNEEKIFSISLPYLKIEKPIIGIYSDL